jgi:hypothetical protein
MVERRRPDWVQSEGVVGEGDQPGAIRSTLGRDGIQFVGVKRGVIAIHRGRKRNHGE